MKILPPTTRTLGLVMAMLHGPWALATDASRQPVTDAAPLMRQALAANDGKASGVLTGESANAISRRFQTQSPIHIDVRTERRYAQHGCARLKVLFWQDGVLLPGAEKARRQSIEFGIDYCASGEPPASLQ